MAMERAALKYEMPYDAQLDSFNWYHSASKLKINFETFDIRMTFQLDLRAPNIRRLIGSFICLPPIVYKCYYYRLRLNSILSIWKIKH